MPAKRHRKVTADSAASELRPGDHLRAEIKRLGLNQVAISRAAGVSRQSINNIINGRQPISRAMAGRLGRLTGRSSDYWLQSSFRHDPARRRDVEPRTLGVGILVNHQILRAVKEGVVRVEPFDETRVQSASLDLTLDDVVITTADERISIARGKHFVLKHGRAVNARTRERIELPRDYIGRAGANGKLAQRGIVTFHKLQIEPGYMGPLQFLVLNAGGHDFEMRAGDCIISIELIPLSATPMIERPGTRRISRRTVSTRRA